MKSEPNPNIEKLSADVEIIVNKMPTTDSGSKNYAIVTFDAGGDTLLDNWKLTEFILKDENKNVLQELPEKELNTSYEGKGRVQMKVNVRNLPSSIPQTVIARVTFKSDGNTEFTFESNPMNPMVVQ
jgi:hypothetical protein